MILRLLKSTEWGQLLDFVSPSFFDVLPARALARQAKDLFASNRDREGFAKEARGLGRYLARRQMALRVSPGGPRKPGAEALPEGADGRRERGQKVLRLYFEQLLGRDVTLLDLRRSAFLEEKDGTVFAPTPGLARWDPAFLASIRRLYAGFYEDRPEEFEAGLEALGLSAAADLFLDHFGEGDQTAVRFETSHFTRSFHDVFLRCREAGSVLQGDFVALGIYLACLYEHLEALDVELDVRAAFCAARADAPS